MSYQHEPADDPASQHSHRVIEAIKREYEGEAQTPRFVVFIEMPPDGRVAIASTADDAVDTLRISLMAHGAARSGVRATGVDPIEIERGWSDEFRRTGHVNG